MVKKISNKIISHSMSICAAVAAFALFISANSATSIWHYQPKAPKALDDYKKTK